MQHIITNNQINGLNISALENHLPTLVNIAANIKLAFNYILYYTQKCYVAAKRSIQLLSETYQTKFGR